MDTLSVARRLFVKDGILVSGGHLKFSRKNGWLVQKAQSFDLRCECLSNF